MKKLILILSIVTLVACSNNDDIILEQVKDTINSTSNTCNQVVSLYHNGKTVDMDVYTARCIDNVTYQIGILDNGSGKVLNCNKMASIGVKCLGEVKI